MLTVFRYTLHATLRSRWALLYFGFFLIATLGLVFLSTSFSKIILSLLNLTLALVPLMSLLFSALQYYQGREFTELLLAQPVGRSAVLFGQLLGLMAALVGAYLLGVGIPLFWAADLTTLRALLFLIAGGIILTAVFTALGFALALATDDKAQGMALALACWLFFVLLFDGILLTLLILLKDYPVENLAIALTLLNPIDLARIYVLLQIDVAALLGYTGALFRDFFGQGWGSGISLATVCLWLLLTLSLIYRLARQKDF
ncbi:MAG: ABC transporter permease [Bacteroidia bacterium]